jgi:hypothetical protein
MSEKCHKRTHALRQNGCYSITSSARPSINGGTVRPNALAVLEVDDQLKLGWQVAGGTGKTSQKKPQVARLQDDGPGARATMTMNGEPCTELDFSRSIFGMKSNGGSWHQSTSPAPDYLVKIDPLAPG